MIRDAKVMLISTVAAQIYNGMVADKDLRISYQNKHNEMIFDAVCNASFLVEQVEKIVPAEKYNDAESLARQS